MTQRAPEALRRAASDFLDYMRIERGSSPQTIEAYGRELRRYVKFLSQHEIRTPGQVRPTDVQLAVVARAEEMPAPSTLNRALATIRHFHKFCVREGLAESNPAGLVDGPKRKVSVPKAIDAQAVSKMIDSIQPTKAALKRDKAILELLYSAGLRVSELTGLDVDDIDLDSRMVRCRGKGNKQRVVPVGRPAAKTLNVYLTEARPSLKPKGAALFVNSRGTRLSRQSAWKVVKKLAAKVMPGKRVYPHALRHSFATHLVDGGADLRVVQEALGHARLSTTQVYTLVGRRTLKEAVDKYHPRGNRQEES